MLERMRELAAAINNERWEDAREVLKGMDRHLQLLIEQRDAHTEVERGTI